MSEKLKMGRSEASKLINERIIKANELIGNVKSASDFFKAYPIFVRELEKWRGFTKTLLSRIFEDPAIAKEFDSISTGGFHLISANDYDSFLGYESELLSEISQLEGLSDKLVLFSEPENSSHTFATGETFDALNAVSQVLSSAKKEIFLIDGYVNISTLNILSCKEKSVTVRLLTLPQSINDIFSEGCRTFQHQHGDIKVKYASDVHDRFIIIDKSIVYQSGGSIKDLGKKISTLIQISNSNISSEILKILEQSWINSKDQKF